MTPPTYLRLYLPALHTHGGVGDIVVSANKYHPRPPPPPHLPHYTTPTTRGERARHGDCCTCHAAAFRTPRLPTPTPLPCLGGVEPMELVNYGEV